VLASAARVINPGKCGTDGCAAENRPAGVRILENFRTTGTNQFVPGFAPVPSQSAALCCVAKGRSHYSPEAALGVSAKHYSDTSNLEARPSSIVSEKIVKGF